MSNTVNSPERLVIATRASRLALWQANHVRDILLGLYPNCQVDLLEMTTKGDRILDRTLSKVGGKGLFIKELETALLDGRADLAVHSLKDVPVDLTSPFSLSVIMQRDDPRDAFVSNKYNSLDEMPANAIVGTSSLRRESQVRNMFPRLDVKPLRGNLDTRLGKLDNGEYDAIILAAVGLKRLLLEDRIRSYIETTDSLPSAGQGALGIEILESRTDMAQWLAPLRCENSTACSIAERTISKDLGGSCQVPIAAYANIVDNKLNIKALVAKPDGSVIYKASANGNIGDAKQLGHKVAQDLIDQGAEAIIKQLLIDQ